MTEERLGTGDTATEGHDVDRATLQARIVSRLERLDDETLRQVDAITMRAVMTEPAIEAKDNELRLLTRRQLLAGLLAGGTVLSGSNLATAWYAHSQGEVLGGEMASQVVRTEMMVEIKRLQDRMVAEGMELRHQMQADIQRLRGLLALYEDLERVPLDSLVGTGIAGFERAMAALDRTVVALTDGLEVAGHGLDRFEEALSALGGAVDRVEEILAAVDRGLDSLREAMGESLEQAAPLAEAVGRFFDGLLERLPDRVAWRIREFSEQLLDLLDLVPQALDTVRNELLRPARRVGIGAAGEAATEAWLIQPLRARVLGPARALLQAVENLAEAWRSSLVEPVQQSLERRQAIRREIEAYRQRHHLF